MNKKVDKKINKNLKQIIYFFFISHGLPFFVTGIIIILCKSGSITNIFFAQIIYLSMLSSALAAFFILFNFYGREER
jgi:hypothetical protein